MHTRPIRFFHRGRVVEVADAAPTRSVLDWLREDARCTGTKEGCNEGDCGACTVVIGTLAAPGDTQAVRGLSLQTVNACIQFLPTLDGKAFTFRNETGWVAFYGKTEFYDFLPKVLTEGQIDSFGAELASFHMQCQKICHRLPPTWKSMGSDIAQLFDSLSDPRYCAERNLRSEDASMLKTHCDRFLHNAEDLGYHGFEKLPVLVDWNTGNFSVGLDGDGFKLFTRWDYDWFRIEPRTLDFYFASRVVRSEGDQTIFSYLVDPLLEPRFIRFMKAYDAINPLADEEILFLKEVYRFFILNYVIREGQHFFQGPICQRLQREAVEIYLPTLDAVRFEKVIDALGHGGA